MTASPVAKRSAVPVTTSPLLTPIRACNPSSGTARLISLRRAQRAQRIVLMHNRNPEDRHHRITDELVDDAAVRLHDRFIRSKKQRQQRARRLRIDRLPNAVEPTTSQNNTVTIFRCTRSAVDANGAAQ